MTASRDHNISATKIGRETYLSERRCPACLQRTATAYYTRSHIRPIIYVYYIQHLLPLFLSMRKSLCPRHALDLLECDFKALCLRSFCSRAESLFNLNVDLHQRGILQNSLCGVFSHEWRALPGASDRWRYGKR